MSLYFVDFIFISKLTRKQFESCELLLARHWNLGIQEPCFPINEEITV